MRFWKKKEEPKEEPKKFEPCLDTMIWLYKEYDFEDIEQVIEDEFDDYCELCPVCRSNWVFEGQWCWYVEDEYMHMVYQELANGSSDIDSAASGLTDKCCETCYYEDGLGEGLENKEGSYIRHLCYKYGTRKEYGCEAVSYTHLTLPTIYSV